MERGSDQTVLSFNAATGILDQPGGAFSMAGNLDAWNVNPLCPPIRKSYIISSPNTTDNRAAYSQFNVANRDFQTFGAAPVYPPPTFSAFPTSSFRGILLPITGRQLDSGRLLYGKGNGGFNGAMGRILEPSQVQSIKSAVQPFDSCQKRLVMFDCEGSKRRMIFHPALVSENSAFVTSKSQRAVGYDQDTSSDKDSSEKGKYSSALIAPLGAPFSIYSPHTQPTNANLNFIPHTSDNLVSPFSALRDIAEANFDLDQVDISAGLSNFSHEDTEDLEALLSSDEDEVSSTGHTPSDITKQTSPVESHNSQVGNRRNSKRMKRGWEDRVDDDDDDMRSTGTSGNSMPKVISSQKLEGAGMEAAYSKEGAAYQVIARSKCLGFTEEMTACNVVVSDELSSTSSAKNKKCCNKLHETRQGQQPDRQSKKEKIRSILHLLRGILPGGESMDASFVLDETIQYVKTLQFEVQKLQAGKVLKL